MIDTSDVLFYYTESAVHAGDGASTGTVDLPIQRDLQTGHPIFRYGTVKGSIRDACRQSWEIIADVRNRKTTDKNVALWETIFGPDSSRASEHAGAATFSDARILLFPVRSLAGVTAWITCPLALAFFQRDTVRAGKSLPFPLPPPISPGAALVTNPSKVTLEVSATSGVVFEEFHFTTTSDPCVAEIAKWLATNAFPTEPTYDFWTKRLFDNGNSHLVILNDDDFVYFVEHATNVVQRININHDTGTVNRAGLWTEETLPSDCLLYNILHFRHPHNPKAPPGVSSPAKIANKLREGLQGLHNLIQLGGNETVGQGLLRLRYLGEPHPVQEVQNA